ncbi:hypothetical protein MMC18_001443 [Xylographa bjoerkii]|nr:hypothetical protein [Xylographa bjoerkii]
MSAPQDSTAASGKVDQAPTETPKDIQKPTAALEEDDEFEDFPVEGEYSDWPQEDAEVPGGNTHLWEESWDDDDTSEDFSKQLKSVSSIQGVRSYVSLSVLTRGVNREELEKVKAGK